MARVQLACSIAEARPNSLLRQFPTSAVIQRSQRSTKWIFEIHGVHWTHSWTWPDTVAAYDAWHHYIHRRHRERISKRPIADILIGAFAMRFDGLLTRNIKDFGGLFPDLRQVQNSPYHEPARHFRFGSCSPDGAAERSRPAATSNTTTPFGRRGKSRCRTYS